MDQTSWDKLGTVCDHRPHVNLTRVTFRLLAKKKSAEEEPGAPAEPDEAAPSKEEPAAMEVEGSEETNTPSTP